MTTLLYDAETDGLLAEVTKIHCIVVADTDSGEIRAFHNNPAFSPHHGSLEEGLAYLGQADRTAGHNILDYDAPMLRKLGAVGPDHRTQDRSRMIDTAVLSRLAFSDRMERDYKLRDQGRISGNIGLPHSLKAWGARFEFPKGDFDGPWHTFTQEMLTYCIRDVEVNLRLFHFLLKKVPQFEARGLDTLTVEHLFAGQLHDQERRGVKLDRERAEPVLAKMRTRRDELADLIQKAFPPKKVMYAKNKKTGKQTYRTDPNTGIRRDHKLVPFNPGSRQQLADRLIDEHGWVPKELTSTRKPSMVEEIMIDLAKTYPEVAKVTEWLILNSRITVLEDGPSGYFQICDDNDILHGRTLHIGTVTHRCSHSKPNLGNVTARGKPYGRELREIFVPHPGYIQAGFDADGLEQRLLANVLYPFDGGRYADALLEGSKEDGTDPHSRNAAAISEVVDCDRDQAKTDFYAYVYGAGDTKLGKNHGKGRQTGARIRAALEAGITGLQELMAALRKEWRDNHGSIFLLDGRRVGIRSDHALLNSKLQGNGAVVMKWLPVLHEILLPDFGIMPGKDWLQTGHVHDELQGSLRAHLKEPFTESVRVAFEQTTEALGLQVPVTGTVDYGANWFETH